MTNDENDDKIMEKINSVKNLQQSEATLHWQRNGFFLVSSSILLVAVGLFHTNTVGLAFGILGLVMNGVWFAIQFRSSEYTREWKKQVKSLEGNLKSSKIDLYTPKARGIEMRLLAMILPFPFIMIWSVILALSIYGLVYNVNMIPASPSTTTP